MPNNAVLMQEIEKLPQKYLGEVIDFVGYLQQKAQRNNEAEIDTEREKEAHLAAKLPAQKWINPLFGIAKSKGATLTLNRFMEQKKLELKRPKK